jgi:methylmalonyl-CoA mutase N-terminal domain/subunit
MSIEPEVRKHAPMYQDEVLDALSRAQAEWEEQSVRRFIERVPEKSDSFQTRSGIPVKRLYTPRDVIDLDYVEDLGFPGEYPFTRGPYSTMYRAQTWTMRQIAGFGTASDTNSRFKYLIAQGQTGISTDFDMPTLMGYDSDDPRSFGEVGREGVAVDTLVDMEELYDGIDLGQISVSMTINPTAWILLAMYLAVADKRGIPYSRLSGTTQADIIKEFTAQKEWCFPIRPSVRLVRDMITFGAEHLPRYNPVNISGYHIREAGSTAVQEAAFTLAAGIAYVDEVTKTGMPVDVFAPRLSFYFIAQTDFFEEVAKFRAARRVWARIMKERFGAKKVESMRLRFHCQTAGSSLTAVEPLNNIARTAIEGLAAVLGGCQSLHTSGMDEALTIPSELAMKVSLRTQQIIADETGVTNTVDPLAGSYFLESLTNEMEAQIWDYLRRVDDLGGTIAAVEQNFFQKEIADASYEFQRMKDRGELAIVGVNKYKSDTEEPPPFELHPHDPTAERRQLERLAKVKAERDNDRVQKLLGRLEELAQTDVNLMPITIELVKAHATGGEIVKALKEVWGTYTETSVF